MEKLKMVVRISIFSFLLTASILLSSCATQHSEITLVKFDKSQITMGEFEKAYAKNSGGFENAKNDTLAQLENFLNLYSNFKMKLMDASVRGYEKDIDLQSELLDYKKKVGVTYLLEKYLVEPAIKDLYEKRKYELRCSHIMIRPDTLGDEGAKKLATEIITKINNGESFDVLAEKYSDDQFSKKSGGDIYYITAGMLIPEFEDAAYETKVGGIYPAPVKTRFGYHVIKVTEKQERVPQIRASHVLVDFFDDEGKPDTALAIARIDSIKQLLKEGKNFADVVERFSKDTGSKKNGGDLNYFERRMMIKEFDEAAFNLQVNEISDVVKTNYGFHIIKLTEKKPYPSFEEDKENLKKIYKQFRYNTELEIFSANLKKKYNYKLNESAVNFIAQNGDSVRIGTEYWEVEWRNQIKDTELFSFTGLSITVDSLFYSLKTVSDFNNKFLTKDVVNQIVQKKSDEYALELEALNLDKINPEFASLMDDYKHGIFIFKLQDEEVWGKIALDSARLFAHYEKNKSKYNWTERISYQEIFVRNDSVANDLYKQLKDGADFTTLVEKHTERYGMKEKLGMYDLVDVNSNPLAKKVNELTRSGQFTEPFPNSGGFVILRLVQKDNARTKTFEEAKAEVSGSFQEEESKRLENAYVDYLKKLYKPEVFKSELTKAFKGE
jgi:peptidyl-prolyl cis-trans isomerase SurA